MSSFTEPNQFICAQRWNAAMAKVSTNAWHWFCGNRVNNVKQRLTHVNACMND